MKLRALTAAALMMAATWALGHALVMWPAWVVQLDLHPTIRVR